MMCPISTMSLIFFGGTVQAVVSNFDEHLCFRAVVVSETQRLTGLSEQWEVHFDDVSIPEESEYCSQ